MKIALMIALPTNKGFIFPPFLFSWLTTAPREQSSSARKLHWGCRERGSIPWKRCGSKGGCCSKVKWINLNLVHSRSWLLYFDKVSVHLFKRPPELSSQHRQPSRDKSTQGKAGAVHRLDSLLLRHQPHFPSGTVPDQQAQLLWQSLCAAVLLGWNSIGSLSFALWLLQPRHKLTKSSLFVPIWRLLIA